MLNDEYKNCVCVIFLKGIVLLNINTNQKTLLPINYDTGFDPCNIVLTKEMEFVYMSQSKNQFAPSILKKISLSDLVRLGENQLNK